MQSKTKSSARSLLRLAWQAARVIVMLMLTAGALFVPSQQALAAGDYTVNRADDIIPRGTGSTCITPASTDCTLREAVIKANANPGSTIHFAYWLNGWPITLYRTGNDANANAGDLDINANMTIVGNGASETIIQGALDAYYTDSIGDKVFGINQDGTFDSLTVSFSGLTIRYGDNTIASGDPSWAFTGGGVDVFQTGLGNQTTFTNCVISYNRSRTSYGGGVNIDQGAISGGYPVDATGSVSFTNVTFDHNQTITAGGQVTGGALNIFGVAPVVTISASTFTNNSTPSASAGGAIYFRTINGGSLSIDNSVFSGNSSGVGGAISAYPYNAATTVTIQNSQFTGNTASDVGGALSLEGGLLTTTPFQLTNLLVSGNTASSHGGGIYVGNARVTLSNSRIVNNTATSDASSKGLYKDTQAATVTATNNWWGCSTGPSAAPCDTAAVASGGTLVYTPWFRDRLTAAASPLVTNQSTTLTASFLTNSAGGAVLPADLAQIIGQPVTWGTTAGALSGTQTTIQATGAATGTFQASAPGTATIYAKVDNDPTSGASSNVLSLTVNKAGTTTAITGDSPDPSLVGQAVAVSYTVTGDFDNSPTAPTGNVTVSDGIDSCTGTVAAGACNITLTTSGARTLTATYAGDTNFNGSTSAGAAHTVNALPDLTLSKSNNLGGAATLGSNWTWTLHVANGPATTPANFAAGQTILVDDLDNSGNLSYGSPSAANFTNITNSPNISCAITSNRLTCSATGAVTIGASGSFDVAFTVTPGQVGSYTNPRSAGSCAVDPDGVVAETGDANNSCNTDSVTVSAPDLTVSKSNNFGGSTTLLGQAWYWRLHVANGSAAATARFTTGQVILTDDLPDNNITYGMPFTQNDTNITNIGNVSCSITNSTLTCIATGTVVIGASGSFDVIITPTPSMIGTYTNPRSGGACKVNPNNAAPETDATNNNCNSNSVTVIAPDLSISKANNVGGAVLQTGTFNWTLTVVNTGEASALFAPGMTIIEDALDDSGGLTFGMPSVANVTNVPGSANIICGIDGGKNLACIASASPVTIGGTTGRFDVVIPVTAVSEGTYSNPRSAGVCHIDANSYAESDTSNNNCNADSVTVMPAADLAVTKTDAPDPVSAGENLSYVINLVNNGPSNAQTVSLTDPIPAGATFVSADVTSGSGWTTSAPAVGGTGNVVFTKSAMSTGEAATFQVVVRLNSNLADGSTINNTATAATATPDLFGGNDNATAATTVQTRSDLSVTKTAPPTVLIGLNFDYTITVTNNSPSDSQGVTLTDGLPPYINFVSQSQLSGPSFTLSNVGDSVTDSISTLPAGASAVIKITASVDANTPFPVIYCNAVNLSATTSDPNGSNNSSIACSAFKLNHPPVIAEGGSVGVSMSKNGIPTPFALTLHATDADLDPLTWSILSPPSNGTASVITTTGVVSYTPNTDYVGADSFAVQVSDGYGGTDSIVVNVTVKESTTTTLVSSLNPSVSGDLVVFTATVAPDPGGGTVAFKDGAR